jgi:hypothetical protein
VEIISGREMEVEYVELVEASDLELKSNADKGKLEARI